MYVQRHLAHVRLALQGHEVQGHHPAACYHQRRHWRDAQREADPGLRRQLRAVEQVPEPDVRVQRRGKQRYVVDLEARLPRRA